MGNFFKKVKSYIIRLFYALIGKKVSEDKKIHEILSRIDIDRIKFIIKYVEDLEKTDEYRKLIKEGIDEHREQINEEKKIYQILKSEDDTNRIKYIINYIEDLEKSDKNEGLIEDRKQINKNKEYFLKYRTPTDIPKKLKDSLEKNKKLDDYIMDREQHGLSMIKDFKGVVNNNKK